MNILTTTVDITSNTQGISTKTAVTNNATGVTGSDTVNEEALILTTAMSFHQAVEQVALDQSTAGLLLEQQAGVVMEPLLVKELPVDTSLFSSQTPLADNALTEVSIELNYDIGDNTELVSLPPEETLKLNTELNEEGLSTLVDSDLGDSLISPIQSSSPRPSGSESLVAPALNVEVGVPVTSEQQAPLFPSKEPSRPIIGGASAGLNLNDPGFTTEAVKTGEVLSKRETPVTLSPQELPGTTFKAALKPEEAAEIQEVSHPIKSNTLNVDSKASPADSLSNMEVAVEEVFSEKKALETKTQNILREPANSPSTTSNNHRVQIPVSIHFSKPEWSGMVADRTALMFAQNISTADLQLDPPELGPLQVKVSVNQDQASVIFTATNPVVRDSVDQGITRLRELLSQQGLDLVNVDVSSQQQSSSQQQDHSQDSAAQNDFNADEELSQQESTELQQVNINYGIDSYV